MEYLKYLMLLFSGVVVGFILSLISSRLYHKQRLEARTLIDEYLNTERLIHAHIRGHVLREKDLSWAVGVPPIVTFGIKSDGTLMSDEEIEQARRIATEGS